MCEYSSKYGFLKRTLTGSLLILALFISYNLSAQTTSDKGWIEVDYTTSCTPMNIEIRHTGVRPGPLFYSLDGDPNDIQNNEYENSALEENSSVIIEYSTPGTYTLVVVDQPVAGAPQSDFITFTVLPNAPPSATYTNCEGRAIQVTIDKQNDPFDEYLILWDNGDQSTYSGDNPINYTYAQTGNYTISIRGLLNNGESISCQPLRLSVSAYEELPTPVIEEITVHSNSEIELTYEPLFSGLNYTLQIDYGSGFEGYTTLNPQANQESITLDDPNFNSLEAFYGFKIVVTDACSATTRESEAGYSIGFGITQSSMSATYDVAIQWQTTNQNFGSIDLLIDGTVYQSYTEPAKANETLNITNCNNLGELRMSTLINNILSTSITQIPFEAAPPTLPATDAPNAEVNGAVVDVSFPPTIFDLGDYVVYRKDIDPDFQEVFRSSASQYTDTTIPGGTGEVCYKIAYTDECGNISELSDEICLVLSTSLGIPNAFSPNGDGINDLFKISDGIYNNFRMTIFNRWGTLVFNTSDPTQGWNGEFEGQQVASGTYLYQISFQNADNLIITRSGSFVLIR